LPEEVLNNSYAPIVTRVSTATVTPELFYSGGLPAAYTLHGTAGAAEY
jgi:hypothetical protein